MLRDRFLQIGRDKRFDDHGAPRVLFIENALIE